MKCIHSTTRRKKMIQVPIFNGEFFIIFYHYFHFFFLKGWSHSSGRTQAWRFPGRPHRSAREAGGRRHQDRLSHYPCDGDGDGDGRGGPPAAAAAPTAHRCLGPRRCRWAPPPLPRPMPRGAARAAAATQPRPSRSRFVMLPRWQRGAVGVGLCYPGCPKLASAAAWWALEAGF